jgi:hypothetical protein
MKGPAKKFLGSQRSKLGKSEVIRNNNSMRNSVRIDSNAIAVFDKRS